MYQIYVLQKNVDFSFFLNPEKKNVEKGQKFDGLDEEKAYHKAYSI